MFKIKPVNVQSISPTTLIKRVSADMELSIYPKLNIYLYSYKTKTTVFIATTHEKTITAVILTNISFILNFWPVILQKWNKENIQKFTNSVKYSSEFLAFIKKHLGHTGTPTNVQNNYIKLCGFGIDRTRLFLQQQITINNSCLEKFLN